MTTIYDIHPLALLFPQMGEAEYQVLKDNIKKNGLTDPITLHEGMILDGRHRYQVCGELGIEPRFEDFGGESPVEFVYSRNLTRRHLDKSQRAAIALDFKAFFEEEAKKRQRSHGNTAPGRTHKEIVPEVISGQSRDKLGEKFGVSGRYIDEAEAIRGADPEAFEAIKRGNTTISAVKKAHVANNSGDNEWYTPPEFIEAARKVMGGIDIDPASSHKANETVLASSFYTQEQDGLTREWPGRVWLNPPYAQPLIAQFTTALVEKITTGKTTEAIVLVNNATETKWFQELLCVSSAICFTLGRIHFLKPDGVKGSPLQGQAILYFGDQSEAFVDEFKTFGATSLWVS